MIHEGQLEVFDLTLIAKAPVFIGSGKSYVKKNTYSSCWGRRQIFTGSSQQNAA